MKTDQGIPASGLYNGRVSRFEDLGLITTPYGIIHKVVLVFAAKNNGALFEIKRPYSLSLDRRSHLFRDVSALLGRLPAQDYDLRGLVGLTCQLSLFVDTKANLEKRVRILSIFPKRPADFADSEALAFGTRKKPERDIPDDSF